MDAWRPPQPHPLAALDAAHTPVLRSNPIYTEEEEQEIIVIVDSIEDASVEPQEPPVRGPRRVPSTSSGYGSGGSGSGSHGRATPSPPTLHQHIPKTKDYVLERSQKLEDEFSERLKGLDDSETSKLNGVDYQNPLKEDGFPEVAVDAIVLRIAGPEEDIDRPLSRSLQEDIKACLERPESLEDIENVLTAALEGAGGVAAARLRLQAALMALGPAPGYPSMPRSLLPPPAASPAVPYNGPGVRPGDVTMMPKSTDMSLLAASALFTLDAAKGELLARKLAKGRRRRRRCRAVVAVAVFALLLAAVGCAELVLSRGTRMFGLLLR